MGKIRIVDTAKQLGAQILRDDVAELAAALAYRFFLALFPFFIFVAALSGVIAAVLNVQDPTEQMLDLLGNLPANLTAVVREELQSVVRTQPPGALSLGILGAIWLATSGTNAIIKAMNRAYGVEETRPFWRRYLLALGLTLLAGTMVVGAFVLLLVGEFLGRQIAGALGLQGAFQTAVDLGRWPVILSLLLIAMAFLYWAAPNLSLRWRWVTPGAVLFTAGWLIATYLFSLYVATFSSYNATYGALGGVAVLLIWFYITAFLLLVGAELNAMVDQEVDPEQMEDERRKKKEEAWRAQGVAIDRGERGERVQSVA